MHRQRFFVCAARQQADRAIKDLAQVRGRRRNIQATGLDLCVVQDVIEDMQQRAPRILHQRDHLLLLALELRLLQQFDQAQHAVHGRADFVAHHGQEAVFRMQCRFRRVLGRFQCVGLLALCGDVAQVAVPDRAAVRLAVRNRARMKPADHAVCADMAKLLVQGRQLLRRDQHRVRACAAGRLRE